MKIGLMSATMDGDVLARYFDGAPRVSFPGRAFPVATLHLEDALATTKHWVDRQAEWCHGSHAHQRKSGRAAAKDESRRPPSEAEWSSRLARSNPNQKRARAACRALSQLDMDVVNQQLICELVRWFVDAAAGDVDLLPRGLGPRLGLALGLALLLGREFARDPRVASIEASGLAVFFFSEQEARGASSRTTRVCRH